MSGLWLLWLAHASRGHPDGSIEGGKISLSCQHLVKGERAFVALFSIVVYSTDL